MRNSKGITLIALVITIIVLLILAGVSIAMLTGQNGILTRANESQTETEKASISEKVNMAIQSAYADTLKPDATATLTASAVAAQYELDNSGSTATGTGDVTQSSSSLTITEGTKKYTVTLTRTSGNKSYITTSDSVSIGTTE